MGANVVDHAGIRNMDLPIPHQKQCPLSYQALVARLKSIYFSKKLYFGESDRDRDRDHSKMMKESVRKSHEKSKKVLEEKRKTVQQKICIQKDHHVYSNCYEF